MESAAFQQAEQDSDPQVVRTACILSAGHSGSTLLNLMLGGHPEAVPLGEITHLPKNLALNTLCQCGAPVRECGFWAEVLGRLSVDARADPYALETGFIDAARVVDRAHATRAYRLKWKALHALVAARSLAGIRVPVPPFDRSIAHTEMLFDAVRSVSGARVIVDSSKSYLKACGLYRASPEDTRLIVLCRDGRGVMWSEMKSGMSRERALSGWKNFYQRTLRLLRDVRPEHVIYVRYEDVTQDPEREMKRLTDFLGLPFHPGVLRLDSKTYHLTNGNNMRHRDGAVKATDVSWTKMPEEDLRYFDKHAGDFNARLLSNVGMQVRTRSPRAITQ